MTPKQTALMQTAKLFAIAIFTGIIVNVLFTFFTVAQIGTAFCLLALLFLGKMIYDIELSKAESLEQLNKTNNQ